MLGDRTSTRISALQLVREFRERYVNFHQLWTAAGVPEGAELSRPGERPIIGTTEQDGLRRLLRDYESAHLTVTPEKYLRLRDGMAVMVIEDERPLPSEAELVTFSQTSTVVDAETVSVLTEVIVGRRATPVPRHAEETR
jgi:hypothetical protein